MVDFFLEMNAKSMYLLLAGIEVPQQTTQCLQHILNHIAALALLTAPPLVSCLHPPHKGEKNNLPVDGEREK